MIVLTTLMTLIQIFPCHQRFPSAGIFYTCLPPNETSTTVALNFHSMPLFMVSLGLLRGWSVKFVFFLSSSSRVALLGCHVLDDILGWFTSMNFQESSQYTSPNVSHFFRSEPAQHADFRLSHHLSHCRLHYQPDGPGRTCRGTQFLLDPTSLVASPFFLLLHCLLMPSGNFTLLWKSLS